MFFDDRAFELQHPYQPSVAREFVDLNRLRRGIISALSMLRGSISWIFAGRRFPCLRYDEAAFQ